MATFTLEEIAQYRQALKNALMGVAVAGQETSFAGRDIRRMTPKEIRETLDWLDAEEAKLSGRSTMDIFPAIPGRQAW